MKNILFTLLFISLFISCQNKNMEQDTILTFSLSDFEKTEVLKYGDQTFFSDCQAVSLELTDNSMISRITQLEVHEEKIFILDKGTGKLFVFDIEGRYINCISSKGDAGDEYISISSFFIHPKHNTIHIIDPLKNKVLNFTTEGNFISTTNHENPDLGFMNHATVTSNNELFCYYSTNWQGNNPLYNVLDLNTFEVVNEIEKYPYHSPLWSSFTPLGNYPYHSNGNNIILGKMFSDTIYTYTGGNLEAKYRIRNKKNIATPLLEDKFEQFKYDYGDVLRDMATDNIYNTGFYGIIETQNYFFGNYRVPRAFQSFIWDKNKKKGFILSEYISHYPNLGWYIYTKDNLIVQIWNSDSIAAFKNEISIEEKEKNQYDEHLINLVERYDPDEDNPILLFYYLK